MEHDCRNAIAPPGCEFQAHRAYDRIRRICSASMKGSLSSPGGGLGVLSLPSLAISALDHGRPTSESIDVRNPSLRLTLPPRPSLLLKTWTVNARGRCRPFARQSSWAAHREPERARRRASATARTRSRRCESLSSAALRDMWCRWKARPGMVQRMTAGDEIREVGEERGTCCALGSSARAQRSSMSSKCRNGHVGWSGSLTRRSDAADAPLAESSHRHSR